jgi:catechol 2,3-dioxygenase-like lactoylglutathione lyase family enzyme
MFSHVMIGTNDIARAKKFYDATFAAFGGPAAFTDPKGRLVYQHNGSNFIVTQPIDGEPATCANGFTLGFAMTAEQADAWHTAGLANGGTACEDPPGPRAGSPFYLAYLRDPDGHKICALHLLGQNQ